MYLLERNETCLPSLSPWHLHSICMSLSRSVRLLIQEAVRLELEFFTVLDPHWNTPRISPGWVFQHITAYITGQSNLVKPCKSRRPLWSGEGPVVRPEKNWTICSVHMRTEPKDPYWNSSVRIHLPLHHYHFIKVLGRPSVTLSAGYVV